MQAISNAMNSLFEDGSWFVRAKELRLLVVRTSGDLRKPALAVLAGQEFHHDNRSAWVVLEDAYGRMESGWQVRAQRLLAHWEHRRAAFLKNEGINMPEAQVSPPAASVGLLASLGVGRRAVPLLPFREALSAVAAALRPPLEGLVIVLAPTIVEDVVALSGDLEALIEDQAVGRCRWVWVLDTTAPWPKLLDRLGQERALRCECVPDPVQHDKDLRALVNGPPASFGRAAPRGIEPPKRINEPPPLNPAVREQMLQQAGLSPEYLDKVPEMQRVLLGAALAMKDGKGADAIRMQREARALAASLGLVEVTIICQVSLASYLSGLDRRDLALAELHGAVKLAARYELGLQEAQARLALGLLLSLEQRLSEAAKEYAECAKRAEYAKVPLIAIEAWRLAAQIELQRKSKQQAISYFAEALRVAKDSERATVSLSSASEAARRLAELYRERGLSAQAESLYAQADAMERGEVGMREAVAKS